MRSFLEGLGARLHFSETLAGAVSLLRLRRFDVVLSQAQLPEGGRLPVAPESGDLDCQLRSLLSRGIRLSLGTCDLER